MVNARIFITELLHDAQHSLGLPTVVVLLERPSVSSYGDFACNLAMVTAKQEKSNPRELATKIVQHILNKKHEYLEKVEVAGPGFINFSLSKKYFEHLVSDIHKEGENYGSNHQGQGRTAIVEYSSPNIAKPFTIGHLRSTIIGDAVANLLAFSGYSVLRDNHLGDWGTQFGKQIVAMRRWGNLDAIAKSEKPVHELVQLYVKFHEEAEKDPALEEEARAWFLKLEQGDQVARDMWKKCVELSMVQFKKIYEQLHVKFDMMLGESFFEDKMGPVLEDLKNKHLLTDSQGAKLVFFPNEKYPPLMIQKKDGATLYATRDLATDRYRSEKWGKDTLVINEVGAEQSLYFKQIYETEEMLGYFPKSNRVHVGHGLIRFKDGKMSTRKGNTIWLEEVLAEAIQRAAVFNKDPQVAEMVGIGALKYNDLKREASREVMFDWEEILNLKGNSGPYLQYTHARAKAVLRKAGEVAVQASGLAVAPVNEAPLMIERALAQFSDVVERSSLEFAPHHLCTYLFELAQSFNEYYASTKILDAGDATSYRLRLTAAVANVLRNGLKLLGIAAPESM